MHENEPFCPLSECPLQRYQRSNHRGPNRFACLCLNWPQPGIRTRNQKVHLKALLISEEIQLPTLSPSSAPSPECRGLPEGCIWRWGTSDETESSSRRGAGQWQPVRGNDGPLFQVFNSLCGFPSALIRTFECRRIPVNTEYFGPAKPEKRRPHRPPLQACALVPVELSLSWSKNSVVHRTHPPLAPCREG
jgi:hypothetical protein